MQSLLGAMRQAGTWDPLLKCCKCLYLNTCLFQATKYQGLHGTEITACMHLEGEFWRKDAKGPNPASFEALNQKIVQASSAALALHTTIQGCKKLLRHPTMSLDTLSPHNLWETNWALPLSRGKWANREVVVCSCSPSAAGSPNESLLKKKIEIF